MYGGVELAQIRDKKELDVDDQLDAYVDQALLSPAELPRNAFSNLATPSLIDSLHVVLRSQVWSTPQLSLQARTWRAGCT